MKRPIWLGLMALVAAVATFLAMNFLQLPDELGVVLVALHLLANVVGTGLGCLLIRRRQWLGFAVLAPTLAFLGLQLSWLYQCCR